MTFFARLVRVAPIGMVAVLCLCLTGCGSKVTKENAEKIKSGMSQKEVTDILGSPKNTEDLPAGMKKSTWESGDNKIVVSFDKDGKVMMKVSSWDLGGK
jgi:hypothetical protein